MDGHVVNYTAFVSTNSIQRYLKMNGIKCLVFCSSYCKLHIKVGASYNWQVLYLQFFIVPTAGQEMVTQGSMFLVVASYIK